MVFNKFGLVCFCVVLFASVIAEGENRQDADLEKLKEALEKAVAHDDKLAEKDALYRLTGYTRQELKDVLTALEKVELDLDDNKDIDHDKRDLEEKQCAGCKATCRSMFKEETCFVANCCSAKCKCGWFRGKAKCSCS